MIKLMGLLLLVASSFLYHSVQQPGCLHRGKCRGYGNLAMQQAFKHLDIFKYNLIQILDNQNFFYHFKINAWSDHFPRASSELAPTFGILRSNFHWMFKIWELIITPLSYVHIYLCYIHALSGTMVVMRLYTTLLESALLPPMLGNTTNWCYENLRREGKSCKPLLYIYYIGASYGALISLIMQSSAQGIGLMSKISLIPTC